MDIKRYQTSQLSYTLSEEDRPGSYFLTFCSSAMTFGRASVCVRKWVWNDTTRQYPSPTIPAESHRGMEGQMREEVDDSRLTSSLIQCSVYC